MSQINVMTQYNAQRHAIVADLKEDGYLNANVTTVVGSQGTLSPYTLNCMIVEVI